MSTVIFKEYIAPPIDRREILRYMGCRDETSNISALIDRALEFGENKLSYKVCCAEYEIKITDNVCNLGFVQTESRDLAKCLSDCEKIVVFAATIGLELDRLIMRYGKSEPSLAVCLQAFGAERIEALCDAFCMDLKEKHKNIRPRFSAGYGDLPLEIQKDIFRALDCDRRIGLTLNDSLLMSPTKSVTAIVGIY